MKKSQLSTALSINEVAALPFRDRTYSKSLGHGLSVFMKVTTNKQGKVSRRKDFRARYFSPLAPKGKDIHIGTFGDKPTHITPFEAMQQWEDIKGWCDSEGKLPKDWVRKERWLLEFGNHTRTLNEVIKEFLQNLIDNDRVKATTHFEYARKFKMLSELLGGGDDPINEFERDQDGRKKIQIALKKISSRKKFDLENRTRALAYRLFEYAIDQEYFTGKNPVTISRDQRRAHSRNHHPCINWEQLPEFFERLEKNFPNMHPQVILCSKLVLATGLRTGAAARLQWDWIDEDLEMIIIPGKTSGLKRNHLINDDYDHHVPITPQIQSILDSARIYSHEAKYVFMPTRQSRFDHLDPSSVNNLFRNIGYKGTFRAHGVRRLMLTEGQEVFKFSKEVIKKQLGHLPKGKVDQAYDASLRLKERRSFLEQWCTGLEEVGLKFE